MRAEQHFRSANCCSDYRQTNRKTRRKLHMRSLHFNQRQSQHGVTILEVLIAIVVLSFGLLGMLGMITNGLKMTSSSHYRTIAAQQLTAMAEKINANPNIQLKYSPPANAATSTCLTTAGCDPSAANVPAKIANTDYNLWLSQLDALLPPFGIGTQKGVVCIDSTPSDGNMSNFACDSSSNGRVTVKICWNESARVSVSGGGVTGVDSSTDTCLSTQL